METEHALGEETEKEVTKAEGDLLTRIPCLVQPSL